MTKILSFALQCERNFEVGRRSRVGALEGTTKKNPCNSTESQGS